MPDPVQSQTQTQTLNPIPATFIPGPWDPTVAGKKVVWGLGKLGVSISAAPALAPAAFQAIEKLSAIMTPYGISIHVNEPVFEKALPFFIFGALAAGLDYAKMKTKIPWL